MIELDEGSFLVAAAGAMLFLGAVLSAILTPLARRLALAVHLVAPVRPDRLHREVRPYGGGLAIAATLCFCTVLLVLVASEKLPLVRVMIERTHVVISPRMVQTFGQLGLGGLLFLALGLYDDRRALGGWAKLLLQFVCAGIAVFGLELQIDLGPHMRYLYAERILSLLWVVVVVNAYNMLDHADGLAATVGLVILLTLVLVPLWNAWTWPFWLLGWAGMGAVGGFLVHNFPPARLFLGDAGSALLGYFLAALTMKGSYAVDSVFGAYEPARTLIPVAIMAVPLIDMTCVIVSRLWRGRNPMVGDATSHLAHRMLARGWSPRGIVAFAAAASAMTGAASVAMYLVSGPALVVPWLVVAAVLAAMLWVRRVPKAA